MERKDLAGMEFGCLKAISFAGTDKYYHALWNCKCTICGSEKIVSKDNLEKNKHDSCKTTKFYEKDGYCIGENHYGIKFKIDIKHLDKIKDYNWYLSDNGYLVTMINGKIIKLHRLITDCENDMIVDHKNHDLMDNRDENLRVCNYENNNRNRINQSKGYSSKFKGVKLDKRNNKRWICRISLNNKSIHIGTYGTEIEAAGAYNEKAQELFGEFACLNDI